MSMRGRIRAAGRWFGLRFSETVPNPVQRAIWQALGIGSVSPVVSRREAMTIHGVVRARDAVCSISTLPLLTRNAAGEVIDNPLLRQFDSTRTNVVHLTKTLEDMFFDEQSWWHVMARENGDPEGFPTWVEHVERDRVSVEEENGIRLRIRLDGAVVPMRDMIEFESPKAGLLRNGGRLLRRSLNLDKTAALYADNPRPLDYFTPIQGAEMADDFDAHESIREWHELRKLYGTAYVEGLEYHEVATPTPQEMQLVESQKQASIEVANMTGLDTEDLGVSANPRTYQNAVDRRRDRINDLLALYMRAITDRLSMVDITRRGHRVEFDLNDYMKPNPTERVAYYQALWNMKSITRDEIRKAEGYDPITAEQLMQLEAQHPQPVVQPQIGAGDAA